jgi:hypothetical protein
LIAVKLLNKHLPGPRRVQRSGIWSCLELAKTGKNRRISKSAETCRGHTDTEVGPIGLRSERNPYCYVVS